MSETTKVALDTIVGVKSGMTRIFDENGTHVPVTVIKLIPNIVSQVKTAEKEGYNAYQVGYYEKREKLISKPVKGHLKKSGIDQNLARFSEVRMSQVNPEALGKEISLEKFAPQSYVDVTGVSKGKGTQGVVKRYGFRGGPASHGSHFHRRPGSIGNRATPARVFPQKKMPGQMGNVNKTVQNLVIVEVNEEKGYMLIKGSVPGSKNNLVKVSVSIKAKA